MSIIEHSPADAEADPFIALVGPGSDEVTVHEDEILCHAGDRADSWWYVVDGYADVTRGGRYVGTVGPGETIGELSMLDGRPRSATVTAKSDMRLRVGSAEQFTAAAESDPAIGLEVARLVARRLRDLTGRIGGQPDTESDATDAPTASTQAVGGEDTSAASTGTAVWDPFAPGYFEDPTVQFNAIREQEAVHRVETTGAYMFTRYEHVQPLGRDRRLGNSIDHALPNPVIDAEREMFASAPTESILRRDGDEHSRVRRLLQKAFTPKVIAGWRERTSQVTEQLLDALERDGGGDLIDDYALLLPVQIITDMLGLPGDDVGDLRDWSHVVTKTLDPLCTPEERAASIVARDEMLSYFETMYQHKRQHPDDGLLSAMIEAEQDGERMTHAEVLVHTLLLFAAGHETTTNLIGNGAIELFRHPDQRAKLVADPGLDANAIEEVLRYNSPVQMTRRISIADIDVAGVEIPAGNVFTLVSAAANRDPRKWGPTADEFRVDRAGANDQVSFGGGPHFCLGAALARLEGQVALPRLFRRFPDLRPTTEPAFETRIVLRGVAHLPVEL